MGIVRLSYLYTLIILESSSQVKKKVQEISTNLFFLLWYISQIPLNIFEKISYFTEQKGFFGQFHSKESLLFYGFMVLWFYAVRALDSSFFDAQSASFIGFVFFQPSSEQITVRKIVFLTNDHQRNGDCREHKDQHQSDPGKGILPFGGRP